MYNKELRPFTKIFGNIQLSDFSFNPDKDKLGTGKFGIIYKAFWKSKNKNVAIKQQEKEVFYKCKLFEQIKREITVQ